MASEQSYLVYFFVKMESKQQFLVYAQAIQTGMLIFWPNKLLLEHFFVEKVKKQVILL
jgi:hypothetical protein